MPLPAFVIPAISAGVGALSNLFSGSEPDADELWENYLKRYKKFDEGKAKGDAARYYSSKIKSREAGIEAKNSQMGLNNPTDVYSNQEDLVLAEQQALTDIDKIKQEENNQLANTELQIKSGASPKESDFSKVLQGGLAGANMGFQVQSLIDKRLPDDTTTTQPDELGGLSNLMGSGKNQIDIPAYLKTLTPKQQQEFLKQFFESDRMIR